MTTNIQFKAISLNVRGIRTFEKRKTIYNWLTQKNADICFLQETYSTKEIENQWKSQWRGETYFAHGTVHSRGVAILVRNTLDFTLKSVQSDEEGRFLCLEAIIQDQLFLLVNIYAPNTSTEQTSFFRKLSDLINSDERYEQCKIIIGGDFNVTLDPSKDCSGGNPVLKDSVKALEEILIENDLIDIWRVQNPECRRFTWRQKTPLIQRRLDYWFIPESLQDDVAKIEIVPAVRTDHSAVVIEINSLDTQNHGPSFWKINNSLFEDSTYVELIRENIPVWLSEINFCTDYRIVWDWIKYNIRRESISYSKQKAREKRERLKNIEETLKMCEEKIAEEPSYENIQKLETSKSEYEREYDYIVKGLIIRSRATWFEKGERNTKYFLNLENNKKTKTCLRKLLLTDEQESTNPSIILNEIYSFYSNLYDEKTDVEIDQTSCPFLNNHDQIPKLSVPMRDSCEGELTQAECYKALSAFKNNKTPGNDGLSAEFYKVFWSEIGEVLVNSLNYSYRCGELSTTQKQAAITLIEKKGKDRRRIKNWRPISLVNVDVKIGSKAIAMRLEKVLPSIIHYDQSAFVKGRNIFDAVRTINDIFDFTQMKNYDAILTAIDFEKAFDSLNLNFLFHSLEAFGFGESLIAWIKTFYKNISSCVFNNGFATPFFQLKRGVRQGDPLSPYLFIIALELLAINIRNNEQIRGIKVDGNEIKLVIFADDMTTFVRDTVSFSHLINTLEQFTSYSGLKMNHEKTEVMPLGNMTLEPTDVGVNEISSIVKILGVYFTYNHKRFYEKNFESIEKSLKELLQSWSWRGLTLIGRIQVIKSFAIPKILYRVALISCKKSDFVKKINELLYSFIWKGKDKVKRAALINSIEEGGLTMPDIASMISTQRILCIKKYLDNYPASWKLFLNFYLKNVGGKFLFHCNFDYRKLPVAVPEFYKKCIQTWSSLNENNPSTTKDVANQILWNNRFICIGKNSVYNRRISSVGLNKIGDLYDGAGLLVFNMEPLRSILSPSDMYLLISMLDAMPLVWRNLLNGSKSSIALLTSPFEPNSFNILYESDIIPLENVQSKSLYNKFVSKVCTKPTARKKYEESFNTEESQLEWKKIYLTPIRATLSTKLREFQYKILNRILYTNDMLFKFKKIESPLCYFCENDIETIEHFLFLCPRVQVFWSEVCSTFGEKLNWSRSLHIKDIFFRKPRPKNSQ